MELPLLTLSEARSLPRRWYAPTDVTRLYRLFDADELLLYIGVTRRPCLSERFNGHSRVKPWWPDVTYVTVETFRHEYLALNAERAAIKAELPRYNVRSAVARAS